MTPSDAALQKYFLRQSSDDVWLNELRSEYSVSLLGYNDTYNGSNLQKRTVAFLDEPSDSLTEWANQAADYGQVNLFAEYLIEHFGSNILKKSLHSNLSNMASLDQALRDNGYGLDFREIFLRWSVANALNDILFENSYGYFRQELRQGVRVPATRFIRGVGEAANFSLVESFKDWQAKWIWVTDLAAGNKSVLKISFGGEKKEYFRGVVIVFHRDGTREVNFFDLNDSSQQNQFFDLAQGLEKVIIIPVKMEKTGGFTDKESLSDLTIILERVSTVPSISPMPSPVPSPQVSVAPVLSYHQPAVRPADFGLKEGDFIRAKGDVDVFIINDFGFKRLVLSPQICLLYGHLGKRGCFAAVKVVSPQVRDAFKTSQFFTDGENQDGLVYFLDITGSDSAVLRLLNLSAEDFLRQGGNPSSIFLFNTREKNTYPFGGELKYLP